MKTINRSSCGAEADIGNVLKCGIIEEMNREHGERQWLFQQNSAAVHTAALSMQDLECLLLLLGGRPANSCE